MKIKLRLLRGYETQGTIEVDESNLDAQANWDKAELYSGMKDFFGTEICEGDYCIVKIPGLGDKHGRIEFNDGCFEVKFSEHIIIGGQLRDREYLKVYVANHAVLVSERGE
jgi:hypothetical protein